MKKVKSILAVVLLLTGMNVFAQSSPKVYAIVNKADWCSVCKANGPRAVEAFQKNNADGFFELVVNDVTSDKTKKTSEAAIEKTGCAKAHSGAVATGVISFYDAKTKKLLSQITVANSNEEFGYVMDEVRKSATK